jgi:protein-tyrosine-phosphatase/DNA-binding transcriptional ArsR family regulator
MVPKVPDFVLAAGHPIRWAILYELARSDRQVSELATVIGAGQSLVSYHLGRLRESGLVIGRRSAEDGRRTYYRTDLEQCSRLIEASGRALHPGIGSRPFNERALGGQRQLRVLFLCTGNSARSQMAEAFMSREGDGSWECESAGDTPRQIHQNAIHAMARAGLDITGQRSKPISEVSSRRFDHVVTLCDRVRSHVPEFPGARSSHWSVPDPVDDGRPDTETLPAFESVAEEIRRRVALFAMLANEAPQEQAAAVSHPRFPTKSASQAMVAGSRQ